MRIIAANVNAIRAAARRGGLAWLREQDADVLSLQEIRAGDDQLRAVLREAGLGDWHLAHAPSTAAKGLGRGTHRPAGREVCVPRRNREAACHMERDRSERRTHEGPQRGAHQGGSEELEGQPRQGGVARGQRATLDRWLGAHVVDVHRRLHGPGPGPYPWWSWRGRAFDNDAGWRIDYQLATQPLADCASRAVVGRAATYALRRSATHRWSSTTTWAARRRNR